MVINQKSICNRIETSVIRIKPPLVDTAYFSPKMLSETYFVDTVDTDLKLEVVDILFLYCKNRGLKNSGQTVKQDIAD